jgi:hypothetical protein
VSVLLLALVLALVPANLVLRHQALLVFAFTINQ